MEDVAVRLTAQFNNQWPQKETALKDKLEEEKAAQKKNLKTNQSKLDRILNFIKIQQVGSSTSPPNFSPTEDQTNENEDDTTNLNDDSHVQALLVVTFTFSNYMFVITATINSVVDVLMRAYYYIYYYVILLCSHFRLSFFKKIYNL